MAHYVFANTVDSTIADAGEKYLAKCQHSDHFTDHAKWAGFADVAAMREYFRDGYSREAVQTMRDAMASLAESERASTLQRATVGAWDIPSAINGLPVCAVRRVQTAQTPLKIRVNLCANDGTGAEGIARQTARLANAIRAEILKGRAISLEVVAYSLVIKPFGIYQPRDFLLQSVAVDPSRDDQLATALSMQFYRASLIRANGLNPSRYSGKTLPNCVNFGDSEERMMRDLTAILTA